MSFISHNNGLKFFDPALPGVDHVIQTVGSPAYILHVQSSFKHARILFMSSTTLVLHDTGFIRLASSPPVWTVVFDGVVTTNSTEIAQEFKTHMDGPYRSWVKAVHHVESDTPRLP